MFTDSILIIQLPYIRESLSDLIIIESINHFSKQSIYKLLSSFFTNITIKDNIQGELTIVASNTSKSTLFIPESQTTIENIVERFNHLIKYLATQSEELAIFGTSPLGTFLGHIIKAKLFCFIDEDYTKYEKKLLTKKIIHPTNLKKNVKVVLPFLNESLVDSLKNKYKNIFFIDVFNDFN